MNIKCFFGFHSWKKYGGPVNRGSGRFEQKIICTRCNKISSRIS